jgi:mannose/cellobiose epimerase-like protein (N-acyl-D-glucosamine 2-epimerase family)
VTGCLFDEVTVRKFTRRCWPETEIAKAWIPQAEAGEQGAAEAARNALVRMYQHYLCGAVLGGWYDQFDLDNRSLVDSIPASSFYHILCATEAARVLG